jgi:hypothetical protein
MGMSKKSENEPDSVPRFIVRKLPEPPLQVDMGLDLWYECQWEMWDTVEERRAGPAISPLFVDEETAQDFADMWNYSAGPPLRCGSCGHVFAEDESAFGHEYYHLLCYSCSASNEE